MVQQKTEYLTAVINAISFYKSHIDTAKIFAFPA